MGETTSLDLCGKWLFTNQDGNDNIACGKRFRFGDVKSHRLRVVWRISVAATDAVKPCFGLAYEHEMDGRARAGSATWSSTFPSSRAGAASANSASP
jgi:hypothetical protein